MRIGMFALSLGGFVSACRCSPAVVLAATLAACGGPSTKTVAWQEEVRLPSGEVLWIQRSDAFTQRPEPGNPLQSGWWPGSRRYEINWRGRTHVYETDPSQSLGALLLAVRGDAVVIVDRSRGCRQHGFAEFVFEGGRWARKEVGPDLLGQPRNLLYANSELEPGQRVAADEKFARDSALRGPAAIPMALTQDNAARGC